MIIAGYQAQLHLAGLPAAAASAVRSSVFAGLAVADKLGSRALAQSVRSAFVHGIDSMLWVSAGLAAVAIILALAFMPWRATVADTPAAASRQPAEGEESAHERVA